MPREGEVSWELGERVLRDNYAVPGGFFFVYAAVMAWLHLKRFSRVLAGAAIQGVRGLLRR
jgi:hypothetical protein